MGVKNVKDNVINMLDTVLTNIRYLVWKKVYDKDCILLSKNQKFSFYNKKIIKPVQILAFVTTKT